MFADRRARRRGDILTIVVGERPRVTNTITQQTSKTNSVSNPVLDSYLLNSAQEQLGFAKRAAPAASAGGWHRLASTRPVASAVARWA